MLIYYTLYILHPICEGFQSSRSPLQKAAALALSLRFWLWLGRTAHQTLWPCRWSLESFCSSLSAPHIYWSSGTVSFRLKAGVLFCGGIFCPAFTLNLQSYEQLTGRFQHLQISEAAVQGMFSYWRELYEAQSLKERFTQKWNMSPFTRPHVAPNAYDFIFLCGAQKEDFWREFGFKELSSSKKWL